MSTGEEIEERKKQRFQYLLRCYQLSEGREGKPLDTLDIGRDLGLESDASLAVVRYLQGEGLLRVYDSRGRLISVTHRGIVEMERALSNPKEPTEHFPPVNIIQVGQMIDSQIQQASSAGTQILFGEGKEEELAGLIESLKDSIGELRLDDEQESDLQAEILMIEAQMSKSKPNRAIITESLKSAWRILEGAAGGALAVGFIETIKHLLAR